MKRKLIALLTVLALTVSLFAVTAMADEAPEAPAGEPLTTIAPAPDAEAADATSSATEETVSDSIFADAALIKNQAAVAYLVEVGILNGIEQKDGTFKFDPEANITREAMAKMVALGYKMYTGKAISSTQKSAFEDVSGRWSESYVAYCATNGIINGRSEKIFDYAGNVTVTETAKLLLAAAGVQGLVGDNWKTLTLAAANTLGLLEGVTSGYDDPITRDEAALVLARALEYMKANFKAAVEVTEAGEVVADVMMTDLSTMAVNKQRDESGNIYIGAYIKDGKVNEQSILNVTDPTAITLDTVAVGPGYTAVFASGKDSDVTVTGKVNISDTTDGSIASDFTGLGTAFVATDAAKLTIDGMDIQTKGFVRDAFIADTNADVIVKASTVVCMGANPLTEAYDGYVNSANTAMMLSPPWVLGIQGGVRGANLLGDHSSLSVIDSSITTGSWAVLSTDGCTEPVMNVVDSTLAIATEAEGGMSSGDFSYSEKYGTGYGTYSIGYSTQNFYGTTFNTGTYGTILRSGTLNYASSKGTIVLKDANGNEVYTGEGKGNVSTVNTVFGVMTHSGEWVKLNATDGTTFNTEEATILYKDSKTADFSFDNCVINSASGIILQMIDDDDSSVGMQKSGKQVFNTTFTEEEGWPSENGSVSGKAGGAVVTLNLTGAAYEGNAFNGTGYYGQGGDDMIVNIGEGASLKGDISLTETQHVVKSFTIEQYYYLGHVENRNYWNGYSKAEVNVAAGATWTVASESLITKLVVAEGAQVFAAVTENADGTLTLTPAETALAAGTYGK